MIFSFLLVNYIGSMLISMGKKLILIFGSWEIQKKYLVLL